MFYEEEDSNISIISEEPQEIPNELIIPENENQLNLIGKDEEINNKKVTHSRNSPDNIISTIKASFFNGDLINLIHILLKKKIFYKFKRKITENTSKEYNLKLLDSKVKDLLKKK